MDLEFSQGVLKAEQPDSFLTPAYEKQSASVHMFLLLPFCHVFNQFVHSNVHVIFKWTPSKTFQVISYKSACRSSIMRSPFPLAAFATQGLVGKLQLCALLDRIAAVGGHREKNGS